MWRKTPQTLLILKLLNHKGHATNQELAKEARKTFPNLTNTTVHRITSRLISSSMAAYGPNIAGLKIVDINIEPHDHFYCQVCSRLIDIKIDDKAFALLQKQLPGELSKKSMLVSGTCKHCEV